MNKLREWLMIKLIGKHPVIANHNITCSTIEVKTGGEIYFINSKVRLDKKVIR